MAARYESMPALHIIERTALAWCVRHNLHSLLRPPCHIGQAKQTVSGSDAGRDSHAKGGADKGADFGTHQGTIK